MILIVAEKRSVAKAIAKYLGGEFKANKINGVYVYSFKYKDEEATALGLSGHIMDFDFSARYNIWRWVQPGELFNVSPLLTIREEAIPYVKTLKKLAKTAREVYLALDADVEGEAIAYETALVVKQVNKTASIYRVKFNAVTPRDIKKAFQQPTEIDLRLVEKVFTRMQIDLTLGAVFTRFLTLTVAHVLDKGKFLSYGPCQTPVLGIVVNRELERRNFKPEKYYVIKAVVNIGGELIETSANTRFKNKQEALEIAKSISKGVVKEAMYKTHYVQPPEPLDTIELEKRSSRWLGISSKRTLDIAEELYRRGYISYPRTETTIYPHTLDLREVLEELTSSEYKKYATFLLERGFKPTRGDSDDGAHPPIYPTKGATKDEIYKVFGKLGHVAWALYDFVVRHFLATLSPPAVVEKQKIVVNFGVVETVAEGQRTIDPGYWQIYPWEKQSQKPLPRVKVGEEANVVKVEVLERETEPPPQMSESELLSLMKKYGIGTDATMQDHIYTNIKRGYIVLKRGKCIPTNLGTALATTLFQHAPELIEPMVRAKIESALNNIVKNRKQPVELIDEIRHEFSIYYQRLVMKKEEIKKTLEKALNTKQIEKGGDS
ncbi:MAG: type IA DNA topoisomerase [Pyrobaculum sp.]